MPAILFGSISVVVDTSELQRQSFNDAFAQHGLDWVWDRPTYRGLLESNGGARRIAEYAAQQGDEVDADAVHATKSERFQTLLAGRSPGARPGVAETIRLAQEQDVQVGLVTTTSRPNVLAVLGATGLNRQDFDVILSREDVSDGKPSPEVYDTALQRLGLGASDCIAIEDNVGGVAAASGAGITCIALPNANTADHTFSDADEVVGTLHAERLVSRVGGATAAS